MNGKQPYSEKPNEFEHPLNHIIQLGSFIIFLTLWIYDSFFLKLLEILSEDIPIWARFPIGIIVISFGLYLIKKSEKIIFKNPHNNELIDYGPYAIIRHPMYMGELFIYFGLALITFSIISFAILILIWLLMDKMANYEERKLEEILGDSYRKYKSRTGKWIPKKIKEFSEFR